MQYGKDNNIGEYVDHFVSNSFKFCSVLPSRIGHQRCTLLDHCLDNMEGQTETSGVLTTQLSGASGWTDHFPTYIIVRKPVPSKTGPMTITRRKINATTTKQFKEDLGETNFSSTMVDDPSESMEALMDTIMQAHAKNFPLETVKIQRYDKNSHTLFIMNSHTLFIKIKKGDGRKNPASYPCRKMKISKGGTEK
jgi:hypothetical protein